MFTTKGIIVDAGAAYVQDPLYDDLLKVRIPELHGYGNLVKGFQEKSFTKDEDLPWCKLLATATDYYSYYPVLQYKAQNYAPADMVYVQVDNSSSDTTYVVIGLYDKYNEDEGESFTTYNNIDVSEIIANKVDFPEELTKPPTTSNPDEENPDDPDGGGEEGGEDAEGADNNIENWKYTFGNCFSNKNQYYISARFPRYNSGGKHSGIDLAGKTGTPVYAVGDGTVYRAGWGSGFGNHVRIDHGKKHDGKHYYTIYGHFTEVTVKEGTKVKGTQLVEDTEWNKAFKKKSDGTYVKLTSKPKDWDEGGWTKYFKNKGTSRNPVYEAVGSKKQKGTQIGKRGSTGNSTGPHTHFMITTDSSQLSNSQVDNGYIKNPENYISF